MAIVETEQSREIKFTEIVRGPFILRFCSYRKSEDAELNLRSEDYIVSELQPEKAVFVLCDGVGSSFYGNLGSQILGEILLDWLSRISLRHHPMLGKNESASQWIATLSRDLQTELNNKTKFATNIIQKKELTNSDDLTRLAEITQRDDFGTQSNFACGVVWPKTPTLPHGFVLLFWLGNARLRIFSKNSELTHLLEWGKHPDQLREVWSSKDGVLGYIYSYHTDLSTITTVIAYSDGLENVEDKIRPNLNGTQLETLVNKSQSIKDDDVTYLELSIVDEELAGIADDIVELVRKPIAPPLIVTDPGTAKVEQKVGPLPQKPDGRSSGNKRNSISLIALMLPLALFCFFAGLVTGPFVVSALKPDPTETSTSSPTLKPSITASPNPTITLTETPTITSTFTATATFTASATSSLTPTFSLIPGTDPNLTLAVTASPEQ